MKHWVLLVLLVKGGFLLPIFGQSSLSHDDSLQLARNTKIRVGLGFTGNQYTGDLTSDKIADAIRVYSGVNLSILAQRQSPLNFLVSIGAGTVVGQNDSVKFTQPTSNRLSPNRFFATSFIYGDLNLRYRFFNADKLSTWFGAGGGFLFYSPKNEKSLGLLDQDRTRIPGETYNLIMLQVPLRVGIDYNFSRYVGLSLSFQHRFLSSDYLDNIGEMGTRKGNDYLQSLEITLNIPLNPPKESTSPKIYKPIEKDTLKRDTILAVNLRKDSLVREGYTEEPKIPEIESYFGILNAGVDWLNQIGNNLEQGAGEGDYDSWAEAVASDEYDWLWKHLEKKAIRENQFFEYKCNPGETYFSLYERFRVSTKSILLMNGLAGSSIPPYDKAIQIPDTRRWMDMFPDIDKIIELSGASPP